MDVGDEDKLELEDGNGEFRSYHFPSDLQYNSDDLATLSMGSVPGASPMPICMDDIVGRFCTSDSMAGSFHPMIWQYRPSSQHVVFSGANNSVATKVSGEVPGAEIGLMLPHRLTNFPVDAAFIQRAAQFSSCSDKNLADMVNPFSIPHGNNAINLMPDSHPHKDDLIMSHVSSGVSLNHGDMEGRYDEGYPDELQGVAMPVYDSDDTKLLGGCNEDQPMMDIGDEPYSAEKLESKKRKRESQGVELEWTNEERQHLDEAGGRSSEMPCRRGRNPLPITNKVAAKLGKQNSSDLLKGEYMHVRARRGHATNSHSLAERVRREKISERMRLLQDLVPSCSKITGKAVMLDEIINYVQSLQRQVEFLSMKLATVSPNLDFNLDELLPKEMQLVQSDPSTMGCFADMPTAYPPLHNPEPTAYQIRAPNFGNSPDVARRIITSQIPAPNLLS